MQRYRNKSTGLIVDLPENVGEHPVLGRDYEVYPPVKVRVAPPKRTTTPKEKA